MPSIRLTVDGDAVTRDVDARLLLVHLLTDDLDRTGVNVGCDSTNCGACTVLLDGRSVKSCTVLAAQADGCEVTTVQGLTPTDQPDAWHPLQSAFRDCHALQCGYCTPGMIMAAKDLLDHNPRPSDTEIREGLEGNLCRCTGYAPIVAAVRQAADELAARPGA